MYTRKDFCKFRLKAVKNWSSNKEKTYCSYLSIITNPNNYDCCKTLFEKLKQEITYDLNVYNSSANLINKLSLKQMASEVKFFIKIFEVQALDYLKSINKLKK